jgi:hypothetical protein
VADHDRGVRSDRGDDPGDVVREVEHPVGVERGWLGRAAVAADVERDRVEAGLGDGRQLVAPRIPALGEAVHEEHERARALLRDVDATGADVEQAMSDRAHDRSTGVSTAIVASSSSSSGFMSWIVASTALTAPAADANGASRTASTTPSMLSVLPSG